MVSLLWLSIFYEHQIGRVEFRLIPPDWSPACVHNETSNIWKPSKRERQISDQPLEIFINPQTAYILLNKSLHCSLLSFSPPFLHLLPVPLHLRWCFYNLHSDQMKTSVQLCMLHQALRSCSCWHYVMSVPALGPLINKVRPLTPVRAWFTGLNYMLSA